MRLVLPLLLLPVLLAGCGAPAADGRAYAVPDQVNGWDTYGRTGGPIACGTRPVLLTGSHTDLKLSGPCFNVRLTGEHNDVELPLVPGGTIEIIGGHNDVFWHPLGNPSVRPVLLDRSGTSTFHRRTGDE